MIKGRVVVEEWSRPELQAFHLHSPPHPSSADQDVPQEELLVIEVAERGSGGVAGPVAAASGGAMSPATTVSSSAAPGLEMEATNGNIKVEEPPVPPPSAAAATAPAAAGSGSQEDKKPAPPAPTVGFGKLFRFADGLDCVLMAVGTAGAIVHGCSLPIFLRFFADLVNSFGSNTGDPDTMVREVVKVLPPSLPPLPVRLFFHFPVCIRFAFTEMISVGDLAVRLLLSCGRGGDLGVLLGR